MNDIPSRFEWFEQEEGRNSERCRRSTYLVLFHPNGKPRALLITMVLLGAAVLGLSLGSM